ncbi:MAG: energy-coupling factor transporter transmembrane protein EcfT [Salinibacterium sp.]|nr:energy-coupling factor transporter transmembrane protein EcfT [Salinibacterium sp.]
MSVLTPVSGKQAVYRLNPVSKLAASAIISITLVLSIDWVSAAVALALEIVLFFWAGIGLKQFFLRTLPIWIAAVLGGFTILLYGRASGQTYFQVLLIQISDGSIELAIATILRMLAIALPAVVLFITIDPTDLADGLAQILRLPARFVLGALAGLRLVGLFIDDWRSLELARRARGVADRGRLRRFWGQAFALLVLSIRRGVKLATAMESRGFGAPIRRTWARESRLRPADVVLVALAIAIALTAVTVSVITGNWNFIAAQS